jgi:hypothetical protein
MINRIELQYAIDSIAIAILDDVVAPQCGIPKGTISCDIYQTELNEFLDDDCFIKGEKNMLQIIARKFQLPVDAPQDLEDLPLAEICLYVLLKGKYTEDYKPVCEFC